MKYAIRRTPQFKKDYKLALKRGLKEAKIIKVIELLANGEKLPPKYRDHELKGRPYVGYRECHIEPDWLLVYKIQEDKLLLALSRTGTHSDLF